MDPALKLLFTAAIVLAGIVVCFIDFQADNAGPDSFWRFGRRDPVRRLICRGDGSFRRYTKLGLLLWFAVFAAIAKLCFATCCQHSQRELLTEVRNLHPRCRSGASGICGPKQSLGPRAGGSKQRKVAKTLSRKALSFSSHRILDPRSGRSMRR